MRNDLIIEKMFTLIDKIQAYCFGLDYDTFSQNDMAIEACVFNISQLGEISNRVDEDLPNLKKQPAPQTTGASRLIFIIL